jgi:hypothetical protein
MNPFSIDEAASAEIQRIFGSASAWSQSLNYMKAPIRGICLRRSKLHLPTRARPPKKLVPKPGKRYQEVASEVRRKLSLVVGAAKRGEYRSEHLHEIGGITFGMGARIVDALHNYCLTFEGGHFFFRDSDNTSILARAEK